MKNKRAAFALISLAVLLAASASSITTANPYWYPPSLPTGQAEPQWVYIQTITGNQSQTVDLFMPTQAHWRVSGNYVSTGAAELMIYFGSQSGGSKSDSDGIANMTWGVGLEHNGREQVQGNVEIKITATNVQNYTLVAEYDNASVTPTFTSEGAWEPKASPLTRYGQGVVAVNGKIYVFGGYRVVETATVNVLQYYPSLDKWFEKKPMPDTLAYFGTAVHENEIYVIGGCSGPESTGKVTRQVWTYNPLMDTWNQSRKSMPTARADAMANVVDGIIYVIGGRNSAGLTKANEAYNPTTDMWTQKAPMLVPVSDYASAVVDGKIYVIGGVTSSPNGTQVQSALNQIYDPETDTWKIGPSIPNANVSFASAATTTDTSVTKKIYVISGNLNQIYDPSSQRWTNGTPIPLNNSLGDFGGAEVVGLNDKLYAIGGVYMDYSMFSVTAQYTPADDIQPSESAPATSTTENATPSPTVPEFSPATVLALITATGLATAIATRRKMRLKPSTVKKQSSLQLSVKRIIFFRLATK